MFSPRDTFSALEHFVDHMKDVIESKFRSTEARVDAEFATLRGEMDDELASLKADNLFIHTRLEHLLEAHSTAIGTTAPTVVNAPPTIAAPASQDENTGAGFSV